MANSCAASTKSKRTTVWRHWLSFLHYAHYTFHPIQPTELHICLWIVWMFKKKLSYHTVRSYLYSLAAELKFRGGSDIVAKDHSWFIHSTLKHFKTKLGTQPIVYRRPLTVELLFHLLSTLELSSFDVYATMLTVGIFCLLRIGELCWVQYGGAPKFIKNRDLTFGKGYIELTLWQTKTDRDRRGVKKWINDIKGAPFNPYKMVHKLKAMKLKSLKPEEPFFALESGKGVSKAMLIKFLQTHMKRLFPQVNVREWTGISLRKGGATSALRAGVSGEVIQKLGNWVSDIYKGYIDHSVIDVCNAQALMVKTMNK